MLKTDSSAKKRRALKVAIGVVFSDKQDDGKEKKP